MPPMRGADAIELRPTVANGQMEDPQLWLGKEFRMFFVRFLLAAAIGFSAAEILNPLPVFDLPPGVNLLIIFVCGLIIDWLPRLEKWAG